MNTKQTFGFVLAALFALFAISYAMALPVSITSVEVNDVELQAGVENVTLAGTASETVPVVVRFTAEDSLTDLKVKAYIEGYKNDITASTARFDVVNGSTYVKRLSLTLPSVQDMDDLTEGLTLHIVISDKNDDEEKAYSIEMERESYSYNFLQADAPTRASAGEIIAVDVVLKNIGSRELEDSFVSVSIPELGVVKKAYFGDLTPEDCADDDCDKEDARERRVYLVIPTDAKSGDYSIEVKATNYDTTATVKKVISITGLVADDTEGTNITPGKTDKEGIPTSILVLTIVLVVIFVVLLIVLIVLLTKKSSDKSEDFGETSYY
jgi:hypothetical protein